MSGHLNVAAIDRVGLYFGALALSFTLHEMAHAWVAYWKGDHTAADQGRLSPNPGAHLDLLGSIILPLVGAFTSLPLIGWAKPVPVDLRKLNNPKRDHLLIALAGPLSNLLLVILASIPLAVWPEGIFAPFLRVLIWVNAYLGIFNLLPIPPLDGGTVLVSLLPEHWAEVYRLRLVPLGYSLFFLVIVSGALKGVAVVASTYIDNVDHLLSHFL